MECCCGSQNCQGYLGTKKKIPKLEVCWGSKRRRTAAACVAILTLWYVTGLCLPKSTMLYILYHEQKNNERDKPKRVSVTVTKIKLWEYRPVHAIGIPSESFAVLGWIWMSTGHLNHVWEIGCFLEFGSHFPCILLSSYILTFWLDLQLIVVWLWFDEW